MHELDVPGDDVAVRADESVGQPPAAAARNGGRVDEPALAAAPAAAAPAAAAAGAAAGAGARAAGAPRVDLPDSFSLFGDVSAAADKVVEQHYFAVVLTGIAFMLLIPRVAITAILRLFHGGFGQRLGVLPALLKRGGGIPLTAQTLFLHAGELQKALKLDDLLRETTFELGPDQNLRGVGRDRKVYAFFAPDLAYNCLLPLLDPALNNRTTPFYYNPDEQLPEQFVSASTYFSDDERAARAESIARAKLRLNESIETYIPGTPAARVGIIAVGLVLFCDAVNPQHNQGTKVEAFLIAPSNLHPAVAQSPSGVVLAGAWNPPGIVKATKVADQDVSMNASPATLQREAELEAGIHREVMADPIQRLLERKPLIVRASSLKGLPLDYPYQYVAITYYVSNIQGDLPILATYTGMKERHCPVDGTCGEDLSYIPPGSDDAGSEDSFEMPVPYATSTVCSNFDSAMNRYIGANTAKVQGAKSWLATHFSAKAPPAMMCVWYNLALPFANDLMKRIIYDPLHCFFIGLLVNFLDAILLIIFNSFNSTEAGNRAVATFEARLSSLPAFNTGFRLYRAFAGGYSRRSICSGNDNFFLLLLFIPAIGFDTRVISEEAVRKAVLSALEAAMVLAFMLRSEAVTRAGRATLYRVARAFLTKLKAAPFITQQTSHWALLKFHMLMHIVNWIPRGAPAYTNSSRFEAALRILVSRIAARASNNHKLLRDIANRARHLAALLLLRLRGGVATDALATASALPARRKLIDQCNSVPALMVKPKKLSSAHVAAISSDWANVTGNASHVPGSAVNWEVQAQGYAMCRISRMSERFCATIEDGMIVELDPHNARLRGPFPNFNAEDALRDSPGRAKLARVVALFHMHPLAPGCSDGLPVPAAPVPAAPAGQAPWVAVRKPKVEYPDRMFVLVNPLQDELVEDRAVLDKNGLSAAYHAIRRPLLGAVNEYLVKPPALFVLPICAVLRAVCARPPLWASPSNEGSLGAMGAATADNKSRLTTAACKSGPVLVFWPPTRDTWLPDTTMPTHPEGSPAAEAADRGDSDGEEDGEEEGEQVECGNERKED